MPILLCRKRVIAYLDGSHLFCFVRNGYREIDGSALCIPVCVDTAYGESATCGNGDIMYTGGGYCL